jgi:hypothetical protein
VTSFPPKIVTCLLLQEFRVRSRIIIIISIPSIWLDSIEQEVAPIIQITQPPCRTNLLHSHHRHLRLHRPADANPQQNNGYYNGRSAYRGGGDPHRGHARGGRGGATLIVSQTFKDKSRTCRRRGQIPTLHLARIPTWATRLGGTRTCTLHRRETILRRLHNRTILAPEPLRHLLSQVSTLPSPINASSKRFPNTQNFKAPHTT